MRKAYPIILPLPILILVDWVPKFWLVTNSSRFHYKVPSGDRNGQIQDDLNIVTNSSRSFNRLHL